MARSDAHVDALAGRVASLRRGHPELSDLACVIRAAVELGLAADSRALAKSLAQEHALVLREIAALESLGLIAVTRRDTRTLRTFLAVDG